MKHNDAILLCRMKAKTRSGTGPKRKKTKVPAEYGALLYAEAAKLGMSVRDAARLAGYASKKDQTVARIARGDGSVDAALAIRKVLVERGADLPPVPTSAGPVLGENAAKASSKWRLEWEVIGEALRELMTDEQFDVVLADLRELERAHRIVRDGIPSIRPPSRR